MSININFYIEGGRNAGLLTPKVTRNPGGIKIIENCTLCIVCSKLCIIIMSTIASSSVYKYHLSGLRYHVYSGLGDITIYAS